MTLDGYFAEHEESWHLFVALHTRIIALDSVELKVTKSQVAFRRRKAFAWAWIPGKYLRGQTAPLVLSVALRCRDSSPRWKEIVGPRPGSFMHHLELYSDLEIDEQVQAWLIEAWQGAG